MNKKYYASFIYITLLIVITVLLYVIRPKNQLQALTQIVPNLIPTATPAPFIFTTYSAPKIEQKKVYKIAMVGDSMTAALGPHGGGLSEYINLLYRKNNSDPQSIIIDNYAKSSNIQAIDSQLTQKTTISEYTYGPLLSGDYDLILIESYAYNPLSQYGVDEGIKQQNLALNKLMRTLITTLPHASIVFVATIAPNIENYAKVTQPNNSSVERGKQAEERIAYLKNHIAYAKSHNIPLINIYEKSLSEKGDGNMKYINGTDDIHPSFAGVDFIGHEIGNYIHENQIIP